MPIKSFKPSFAPSLREKDRPPARRLRFRGPPPALPFDIDLIESIVIERVDCRYFGHGPAPTVLKISLPRVRFLERAP